MQQKGEYEESRGKWDCKGMACKTSFFGVSVFQVLTKGQQQGYFSSLNFKPSLKPVHYINNGVPRPAFSSVLLPAWLKGEEDVFLSVGGKIQG